jgi:putative two-component system response regulator
LAARIVALTDVYDALTSKRVYKEVFSHAEARAIVEQDSGKHFDPRIVQAFFCREADFRAIRQQLPD